MEEYGKWATFQCEMKIKDRLQSKNSIFHMSTDRGRKSLFRMSTGQLCVRSFFYAGSDRCGKDYLYYFPAVKAVGEELADRIFYLTAKTITATVAKETFALLEKMVTGQKLFR